MKIISTCLLKTLSSLTFSCSCHFYPSLRIGQGCELQFPIVYKIEKEGLSLPWSIPTTDENCNYKDFIFHLYLVGNQIQLCSKLKVPSFNKISLLQVTRGRLTNGQFCIQTSIFDQYFLILILLNSISPGVNQKGCNNQFSQMCSNCLLILLQIHRILQKLGNYPVRVLVLFKDYRREQCEPANHKWSISALANWTKITGISLEWIIRKKN